MYSRFWPILRSCVILVGMCAAFHCRTAIAQIEFEKPPIDYLHAEVRDRVSKLAEKVAKDEVVLEYDEQLGYLPSLLHALEVPVSSQVLVFSKTSLQLQRIAPRRPRALYFNDDVYVGYCQKGDVLELAATDSKQGAIFYTLEQNRDSKPEFTRDRGGCLTCHASSRTQSVPGYLVRSVFPAPTGHPQLGSGSFTTDHTSDFQERWGGWYVSGSHGKMRHMGNATLRGKEQEFDRETGANVLDLSKFFKTESYLTNTSDIVALMVLEHQSQMHNAIAAANYETRLATHQSYTMNEALDRPEGFLSDSALRRIEAAADRVLHQLLFCEEFQLQDQVRGTSGFQESFAARGPFSAEGKSLRQFNLSTRLFEYPCSYLIYSEAFDGMPDLVRKQVLKKLHEILRSVGNSTKFQHLDAKLKSEIYKILVETKPEFAELSRL